MAETGSNSSSPAVAGSASRLRGRMRKGTQSCTECRRRKIKCSFASRATVCSPCTIRGSRCVDQRERSFEPTPVSTLQPTPSNIENHFQPLRSLHFGEDNSSDIRIPVYEGGDRAPIPSFLNTTESSEFSLGSDDKSTPLKSYQSHPTLANTPHSKAASVCGTLRSALPSYDTIMSTFAANGAWWTSFRQKAHAIYDAPFESLSAFAMRAYTTNNPADLGLLVTAYARSTSNNNSLYALVDSLIISDFAYLATLDGLECLILLAKSYTDFGQPRRAWFTWRRGMGMAQLMGLYRASPDSARHQKLWWAIYHGDRFTSLLLGLPYGFNDTYYSNVIESSPEISMPLEHRLILQCAILAGKIIDRNISPATPSFSKTMDFYHQMETMAASMPKGWWDIPDELPASEYDLNHLVERLLQQFFYFHIMLYLHLPFIAKSSENSAHSISVFAGMEASRQMVKIFLILRTKVNGTTLFDCKTSDFISFTAAVVLLVGLGSSASLQFSKDGLQDKSLVESVWKIFRADEQETGCKMASQCRKTLVLLGEIPDSNSCDPACPAEPQEIRIPYFGTVLQKHVKRIPEPPRSPPLVDDSSNNWHNTSNTPSTSNQRAAIGDGIWQDFHEIEYLGHNFDWGALDLNSFSDESLNSMSDLYVMDIDQDWDMFPTV